MSGPAKKPNKMILAISIGATVGLILALMPVICVVTLSNETDKFGFDTWASFVLIAWMVFALYFVPFCAMLGAIAVLLARRTETHSDDECSDMMPPQNP